MVESARLRQLASLIRYYILIATSAAQSGHPTSSLSAVELMTTLFFGGFLQYDLENPNNPYNDRVIFSKGHASPLMYALYAAAGRLSEEELLQLRQFESPLEGHPSMRFPYTEATTGSLGQGLSIGSGMALSAKHVDKLPARTFVLLGDSEMAEGANYEAMELAAHYKLSNLIGIIDVNRLGQRGETMAGHRLEWYTRKAKAFGWITHVIEDGHNFEEIGAVYARALRTSLLRPTMIVAKTLKGKGVSLWENQENWHSKQLDQEQLTQAIAELGPLDKSVRGAIRQPTPSPAVHPAPTVVVKPAPTYAQPTATKLAAAQGVVATLEQDRRVVVLDAEVSNSTHMELAQEAERQRFFEMFIAEQNMVGMATGLSARGKIPVVSSFAAFLTRAHDQIRMSQYAQTNIKYFGAYAGTSLGKDGFSQMGLEDLAMFRSMLETVILQPADPVSAHQLAQLALQHQGNVYVRTAREPVAPLYDAQQQFEIGGSQTLAYSNTDAVTVIASGITVHEALRAYTQLENEGILIRVIDLYSIEPLDHYTLAKAAHETQALITVEDHFPEGGMGEAVRSAFSNCPVPIYSLAVRKMPRSGQPHELLAYEEIDAGAIVKKVQQVIGRTGKLENRSKL